MPNSFDLYNYSRRRDSRELVDSFRKIVRSPEDSLNSLTHYASEGASCLTSVYENLHVGDDITIGLSSQGTKYPGLRPQG